MGDPYAYVQFMVNRIGNFIITPEITTASFNPNLNQNIQSLIIGVKAGEETRTINSNVLKGAVKMQDTGAPLTPLLLAFLLIMVSLSIKTAKKSQ